MTYTRERRCSAARIAAVFLLLAPSVNGYGQAYPGKPLRIIVPWTPGGTADLLARILAQKMTEGFGQQVVADNRPGAGGRPRAVNRVPACGMRTSASRDARRWI